MEMQTENIVHKSAITKQPEPILTKKADNEESLFNYESTMAMVRKMRSVGIITDKDYYKIDRIIAKKYGISLCSIYRE